MSSHSNLNNKFFLIVLCTLILGLPACSDDGEKAPDVSGVKVDLVLKRFDQDLFAVDTANLEAGMQQLLQRYPVFLPVFADQIIHDISNPSETRLQAISGFVKAPQIRHLYDTVQQVYGNLQWLEKDLHTLFQYYKYYFPEKPVPEVLTVLSEFGVDAFTVGDSLCGIGLDMFLGPEFPGYDPDNFPAFIRRQFVRECITTRLAKTLAQQLVGPPGGDHLLDYMIENGKVYYIVDKLLPGVPDSTIMGYTNLQITGCFANEVGVWARILEQNLLYSTDYQKFQKMVEPSPNAPVVFSEAPGEIGNWVGWQIVKSFVAHNPNVSLKEMLKIKDAQKFLEASKYKPKRQ